MKTKENYLKEILNDSDLSNVDIGWLAASLMAQASSRALDPTAVEKCPYTFAHTREWCGREGCRTS